MSEFEIGTLIYGKVRGFPAWPARIEAPNPQQNLPKDYYNVFYFGTHQTGVLSKKNIFPVEKFKDKFSKPKAMRHFNEGVAEMENNPNIQIPSVSKIPEDSEEECHTSDEDGESDSCVKPVKTKKLVVKLAAVVEALEAQKKRQLNISNSKESYSASNEISSSKKNSSIKKTILPKKTFPQEIKVEVTEDSAREISECFSPEFGDVASNTVSSFNVKATQNGIYSENMIVSDSMSSIEDKVLKSVSVTLQKLDEKVITEALYPTFKNNLKSVCSRINSTDQLKSVELNKFTKENKNNDASKSDYMPNGQLDEPANDTKEIIEDQDEVSKSEETWRNEQSVNFIKEIKKKNEDNFSQKNPLEDQELLKLAEENKNNQDDKKIGHKRKSKNKLDKKEIKKKKTTSEGQLLNVSKMMKHSSKLTSEAIETFKSMVEGDEMKSPTQFVNANPLKTELSVNFNKEIKKNEDNFSKKNPLEDQELLKLAEENKNNQDDKKIGHKRKSKNKLDKKEIKKKKTTSEGQLLNVSKMMKHSSTLTSEATETFKSMVEGDEIESPTQFVNANPLKNELSVNFNKEIKKKNEDNFSKKNPLEDQELLKLGEENKNNQDDKKIGHKRKSKNKLDNKEMKKKTTSEGQLLNISKMMKHSSKLTSEAIETFKSMVEGDEMESPTQFVNIDPIVVQNLKKVLKESDNIKKKTEYLLTKFEST